MLNWYLQDGLESDVVISSRVRLARNMINFPFPIKCSMEQKKAIIEKVKEFVLSIGYNLKMLELKNMDEITILSLVEKHLISHEFAMGELDNKAILIDDDEKICIMINEEDHIRLQVFSAGLELENLMKLAKEIDEKIEELVTYACNKKYGYLTSCPTNLGTGVRVSVMVHLPALTMTGNIAKVLNAVNSFGMNIRGLYGEGTESYGDVYQIFNNQSLGISEDEIVKTVKAITDKIIEQERMARKLLTKKPQELEDRVYRAYGVLTNARKISLNECRKLLSDVKLGVDMGIITEIDDLKVHKLQLYTNSINLQKFLDEKLDDNSREFKRAEVIKKIVKGGEKI